MREKGKTPETSRGLKPKTETPDPKPERILKWKKREKREEQQKREEENPAPLFSSTKRGALVVSA